MGTGRIGSHVERVRVALHDAITESYTPREIAWSFAVGTFVTMLPTLGTGLLAFAAIVYWFDRISPLALFASVLVFNPVVKWGVYVASFALGMVLLGPVEGVTRADVTLDSGWAVLLRLLLGNLILAVLAAAIGYVVVYRLAVRFESTGAAERIDETLQEVAEEVLDP